mgnify:CR=1 FL=1
MIPLKREYHHKEKMKKSKKYTRTFVSQAKHSKNNHKNWSNMKQQGGEKTNGESPERNVHVSNQWMKERRRKGRGTDTTSLFFSCEDIMLWLG